MKKFALMTGLAVVALTFLSASDAKGQSQVSIRSTGPAVDAFWEFPQADGGFSGVFLFAGEQRISTPKPQTEHVIFIDIFQVSPGDPGDPSDDTFRGIFGTASLEPGDLELSGKNPADAALQVSVPAEDCTFSGPPGPEPPPPPDCTATTISVDLSWAAFGPIDRFSDTFHSHNPDCIVNGRFSFTGRPAEVAGSVIVESTDYTQGQTTGGSLILRSRERLTFVGDCFGEPPLP